MLEFLRNGKSIRVEAIGRKGKVGQMVIFGEQVNRDENPVPPEYPLSQYSCPSIFTIVEKVEGEEGYYIIRDVNGNLIKVQDELSGAYYLFDAQEWLTWNQMHEEEKFFCKRREIEQLEGYIDLLKDILIKQGIRTVTEAQAEKLGIN